MNYLAHIYLSGENIDIQIGNFMGDAVKGEKYEDYAVDLKKGILLHRQIDSFTDQHPITSQSKKRLHPRYGHYKGVLIDIFFDYFLAKNWSKYSDIAFNDYISNFYVELQKKQSFLPVKVQVMTPLLIAHDWLSKYDNLEGIARVLNGMKNRIKHDIPLHKGIEDLIENYEQFEQDFNAFFPLIKEHSENILKELNKRYEASN